MAKFIITGLDHVLKQLESFEPKLAKKALRSAIRKALKPVLKRAKQLAPVDTGELRAHIKIKAGKRKKGVIRLNVQVGAGDFKGEQYYAAFVEFGHKDPKTGKFIPPNPFMKRAFFYEKEQAKDTLIDEIKKAVDKLAEGE